MTDAFDDLDSARARIRQQVQGARERSAAVTVLADQVAATSATVRSPRGEVSVTATAGAQITDVTVAPGALELRADVLGRLIRDTIAAAQRTAAQRALAAAGLHQQQRQVVVRTAILGLSGDRPTVQFFRLFEFAPLLFDHA